MDGNLSAGYDVAPNKPEFVDIWNTMLTSNDFINANTGLFDPRYADAWPFHSIRRSADDGTGTCTEHRTRTSSAGRLSRVVPIGCFLPCSSPLCTCQESRSCFGARNRLSTSSIAPLQITCSAGNQCLPTPPGRLTVATLWTLSSTTNSRRTPSSKDAKTTQSASTTETRPIQSATSSSPCTLYARHIRS